MSYLKGEYITKQGLKSIAEHKYKPGAYSLTDNILAPFWTKTVEMFPMTMAPNTITFLGVLFVAGFYSFELYYDITMTQQVPRWCYFLTGIGIFLFQTLDAIDGKQARRTGSSSPLGQLFDHGCDAIAWTVTSLSVISFLQLGLSSKAILAMFTTTCPFYLTNLLEMYSGVYEYNIGNVDGTTGQLLLIFFNVVPAFAGSNVYNLRASEVFYFIPSFITREFVLRDYAMVILAYIGLIYAFILIYY